VSVVYLYKVVARIFRDFSLLLHSPDFRPTVHSLFFLFAVQLLHKLSIRGVNGSDKLLKVIKVRIRSDDFSSVFHRCLVTYIL
jgi:hypothetical protein